jgi:hypothetical protein
MPELDDVDAPTADLLQRLRELIQRYVVVTEPQAVVLALWVLHTYAIEAAEQTPYLAITSAEKRSGKTRLMEVLAAVVARPMPTMPPLRRPFPLDHYRSTPDLVRRGTAL